MAQPRTFISFLRSQLSAMLATAVDFGALFFLAEVLHVWYVLATATGAFLGALTNFLINRHWSFEATHRALIDQAKRYALVSTGSLLLNTGGVYLVTEGLNIHYGISVLMVSSLIGFLYNYPLHRSYVYKH